jgi:hypothetical protein
MSDNRKGKDVVREKRNATLGVRDPHKDKREARVDHPGKLVLKDPIAFWRGIFNDVCDQAGEDYMPTASDRAWLAKQKVRVQARLAELRRQVAPAGAAIQIGVVIPPEILTLDRAALIAQLERLRNQRNVRYAHDGLTSLSDNDLRTTLALLLSDTEK